jgi:hypothetical protein
MPERNNTTLTPLTDEKRKDWHKKSFLIYTVEEAAFLSK